jgi:imidazoleglycerol-phosphate dehydratase
MGRTALVERKTRETQIRVELNLDGKGQHRINTPLPFLSHMLDQLGRHGMLDLIVDAQGDTEIDGHHTTEDVGIAIGQAVSQALGDRAGIQRYGWATLPMDEVLVTVAVDFGGRPAFVWNVPGLEGKWIGEFDCELAKEFFAAFTARAQCNLHVLVHYGGNAHHVIECIFKAFARACDQGSKIDPRLGGAVPSTKGSL